jgi:adenosylcobinamide-GDP ribazoletransferase
MMRKELQVFLTAVMFFTRIPCPDWVDHSIEYLNKSSRYFSLIGIIVGGVGGAIFYGFNFIFPHSVSVLLSMLATIWVTGAFHEDGLADMFDGFGGGWTKEQILEIMKDSRIGTFGVAGLTGILALKFLSLNNLPSAQIPIILIAGHALSRFLASTLAVTHRYSRDESSKAKPVATEMSSLSVFVSAIFGVAPLALFGNVWIIATVIPVLFVHLYLGYFFRRKIGGFTGDCSGAVQQLTEVTFYLSLLALI